MKTAILVHLTIIHTLLASAAPAAPDTWEFLPATPFPHGVSVGGGLATDGTYLYAADLNGDGNNDYIDLNDNGTLDAGEALQDQGIPNGSVRVARYDPAAGTWLDLPVILPSGAGGDSFSRSNFNRPLFHAGGFLYYYQMRAGPNRCVLHRYDLSTAPGGAWEEVWDKSTADALINHNAGMVGVDAPGGPVILHHKGGGAYEFGRSTSPGTGGDHLLLTPDWPFSGAHFPRNGSWEDDVNTGRLYHMSGNQLVRWTPAAAYPGGSFLTTTPVTGSPLAAFDTVIASLKDTLAWDPGGTAANPGTSLWGNSLVVVNDPSGVAGGPGGEDTGANVLYMVRGETTPDGFPFNEGRGQVTNGHFARHFPATGATQALPPAPFSVGKGSDAIYLDGYLYLTQGETRTSPDGAGNDSPIRNDGIRRPGDGFARYPIRGTAPTGSPVIPVGDWVRGGFVSLAGSPHSAGGPDHLFDRDWDSSYVTDGINPALVTITFPSATAVGAARASFGPDSHQWTLEAANSEADLSSGSGSFVRLFGPESVSGIGPHWQEWNATPVLRRIFRFTVEHMAGGPSVEIRELELQSPRTVHTVEIAGSPVPVNHMELVPEVAYLLAGETPTLAAEVSLSLGPDRYDVAAEATWSSSMPAVATVSAGTVAALTSGQTTITATFGPFTADARVTVSAPSPHDNDLSVAWIQRLPVLSYVWDSTNPTVDGWPAAGSEVTWRARVMNWWPVPREDVSYRWLLDGAVIAEGTADLAADGLTDIDLPWTWTFNRHSLRFEIDPTGAVAEFSETNNAVDTWTDALTVAFWVEQSLYDYFHEYQKDLGIGSNGWEDWAQRQVARWNASFAAATHLIDAPDGVLDRIRLDKITIVPDDALPLNGGLPTNNPDNSDRTTDLVWGFPATSLDGNRYANHTDTSDTNAFHFEGALIHELGHARYLLDVYGFGVAERSDKRRVFITLDGAEVAGTPHMPRTYPWWDHLHVPGWGENGPFRGLMASTYTSIDRYSTMALNLIAGRRATLGNYNAPGNIGSFFNDLPDENTVQLVDRFDRVIPNPTVSIYRADGSPGEWYGKMFDDVADGTFTGDSLGRVNLGRNPFTDGSPLQHTYGISHAITILRVDAGGKTGFTFLPAAFCNMEYWRGHTTHGYHELPVHLIGPDPDIANVMGWPEGNGRRIGIVAGGTDPPESVMIDGLAADYHHGAWWAYSPVGGSTPSQIAVSWTGGPTLTESFLPNAPDAALLVATSEIPNGVRLGLWSRTGRLYRLQHSSNLIDWGPPVGQRDYFGTGAWLEIDDLTPAEDGRKFSRLQILKLTD